MVSIFGSENILTDSIHEGGNRGTDGKSNSSGDTRNDGCRVGFKDVLMRSLNAVECLDVLGRSLGVQVTLFRGRGGGRGRDEMSVLGPGLSGDPKKKIRRALLCDDDNSRKRVPLVDVALAILLGQFGVLRPGLAHLESVH